MSAPPVTQLGRYRVVQELGRGAMGVVYRAEDPALQRTVAVKTILLSGDESERASYEARFLQEARAAGKLNHPGIVTIFDVGREGDLVYMAMELLAGVDLRERVSGSPLPLREAIELALQIADALGFAHEHGVVHRDIKPGNIMLTRGGRTKIMDFGLARLQLSDVKTQTGILLGTPKYMSPEQIAGGELDHRCDLFSLGSVFYEMLIGRAPFSGSDTAQLLHRIATQPHAAPSRIAADLPPMIDLIVARALEKDPAARYQQAADFAEDLKACLAELSAPTGRVPAHFIASTGAATDVTDNLAVTDVIVRRPLASGPGSGRSARPGADEGPEWLSARRFDNTAALDRLLRPSPQDRARLSSLPRAVRGIRRWMRDPDLWLLAGWLAAGAAVAVVLAGW